MCKNISTRDLIGEIERLNSRTPNGVIEDADTVLTGIMQEIDPEVVGAAQEIFDIWKKSSDKDAVEQLFWAFTGVKFNDYLRQCRDILIEQERQNRDGSFLGNADLLSDVIEDLGWYFVETPHDGETVFRHVKIGTDSPWGKNFSADIWFERGSVRDFVRGVCNVADDFDPDDYAACFVPKRGTNGVPGSIREILADAESIKENLIVLADTLEQWADDRNL